MSDEEREEREKKKADSEKEIGAPYINGERNKVKDIFLGFFLMIGGVLVGCGPVLLILMFTGDPGSAGMLVLLITIIPILIMLIFEIKLMDRFHKKNRRYIVIGMIIPLLIGLIIAIIALTIDIINSIVKHLAGDSLYSYIITLVFVDIGVICLFLAIFFQLRKYSKNSVKM